MEVKVIKINKIDDRKVIVYPEEKINYTNSQKLKKKMLVLYEEGYNFITIDFSEVESIDSSGLGKILLFHKKLKEREGKLKIINVQNEYIKKMFELIHLDKVIEIEDA